MLRCTQALCPVSYTHLDVYKRQMKINISEIRSQCRKLKMDKGLDLIVIDYIQLMQSAPGRKIENRQLEVAEISRSLKDVYKRQIQI